MKKRVVLLAGVLAVGMTVSSAAWGEEQPAGSDSGIDALISSLLAEDGPVDDILGEGGVLSDIFGEDGALSDILGKDGALSDLGGSIGELL